MKYIILIITFGLLITSCTKKNYDLKIDKSDPVLIVDARVHSNTESVEVDLSISTNFLGDNPKSHVDNASVFVTIDNGTETQLNYVSNGKYQLENVKVSEGTKYDLRIVWNGGEYTSNTEMLNIIPISSFLIEEAILTDDDDPDFQFSSILDIDLSKTDYYLTEVYLYDSTTNEFVDRSFLPWDDEAYDANPVLFPYFAEDYKYNDSINIQFSHVSKETIDFYQSLDEVEGQTPSSTAPANPISNFSNGAIGNFGAFATLDTNIRVKL